jgi:hypothetical protein
MTVICIIKRKFKQWLSTIPPIWAKRTITSHLNSISTKKTYDIGNPGHGMCQAQNSDVEVINVIPILPVWLLDFERQCIYKLVRDSSAVRLHYHFLLEPSDVRELYIRKQRDFIFYQKPSYKSLHQSFVYSFITILPSESGVTLHYSTILP